MLAYAAHRRPHRTLSPAALALIIGGHAVAIGLLITARMDVGPGAEITRTVIRNIPLPQDPPPPPPKPQPRQQTPVPAPDSNLTRTPPVVDIPIPAVPTDMGTATPTVIPDIGDALDTPLRPPVVVDPPRADPVRVAARFATPADRLRPPYPENKRRLEEEATLRLRLSIDERGRVTAVEPVGPVDPDFLSAARQHVVRNWRYKPATEDGRPVPTSIVVTLRFELEDA